MNVVEVNPLINQADISTSRYQKRIELYRMRHEQNRRQYQPVWAEEARKQIEETNQLHKRWIEFQAKRTVGKTKNDSSILSSGASTVKKPKRKLPLTPDNVPSVQGAAASTHDRGLNSNGNNNDFNKPNNPPSHLRKMFNTENTYSTFSQPSLVKESSSITTLPPISNVRATFNQGTDPNGAFRLGQSTSNQACNYFALSKASNEKQSDLGVIGEAGVDPQPFDESKLDDGLSMKEDEEFFQFWSNMDQNVEIGCDVMKVLQENETGEDIDNFPSPYLPVLSSGVGFPDNTIVVQPETTPHNAREETSKSSDPLIACAFEASYDSTIPSVGPDVNASTSLHRKNLVEQGVIRNNPAVFFGNQSDSMRSSGPFDSSGTGSMSETAEAESRSNLPSYHDATSGKLTQTSHQQPVVFSKPLITQGNVFNNQLINNTNQNHDAFRHYYNSGHQSYNFQQRGMPTRNQVNYASQNIMAFSKKNCYVADDANMYLYDNGMFQNELNPAQYYNNNTGSHNVRHAGFNALQFQKMNCYSDFMPDYSCNANQRSYHQLQSPHTHLGPAQTTFPNQDLSNNYWVYSGNSTNNVSYDHMLNDSQIPSTSINFKNISCSYPPLNSQIQLLPHSSSNQQALCNSYANMTNSNNITHSSSTDNNMNMFPMMDHSNILCDPSTTSLHGSSVMDCLGISVDAELSIIEDIINGK